MPTVFGTRVKCPECGATSDAVGDAFKCSYCGTAARVQRRTQFGLKMPLPPPPPGFPPPGFPPPPPQRVAVQQMHPFAKAIAVTAGVMGLGVGAMGAMTGLQSSRMKKNYPGTSASRPAGAPPAGPQPTAYWMGRPFVVDVDGDGVSDAIGFVRTVTPDQMFLTAVSGVTGKKIWGFYAGTYDQTYRKQIALSGTAVLVGDHDTSQTIDAYALSSGTKLFTATFGEAVDQVCAMPTASMVKVVTKDKVESLVDLVTGKVSEVKAKRSKCIQLPSNDRRRSEHTDFTMRHSRDPVGMSNDALAGHEAPWIILGRKDPGSRIPMIAAFDDRDRTLWTVTVPSKNPMGVKLETPEAIDVDKELVATMYYPTDGRAATLATFDRATGARRLEVPISANASSFISSADVSLGTKVIFVLSGNGLSAFDRDTGARKWTIGETR